MRRLLIIKLSALGDIAQALPVASALRRQFPHLHVTWAVEERSAALLHGHPGVDRIVTFPRMAWGGLAPGWSAAFRCALGAVREQPYDVALDLQGLFKSSVVAVWSRAPLRLGMPPQREGAALASRAVPVRPGRRHAVERYLECAEYLGAAPTPVQFGLRPQPAAVASLTRLFQQYEICPTDRVIAVSPSAARPWKAWPEAHWAAVIGALGEQGRVVLVGSDEQRRRHRGLAQRAGCPVVDLTGKTSLAELIALLDRCVLHVAPDTGTLHLAVALGRPVVGIYGPTPVWRLGPYGQADAAVHRDGICTLGCPRFCPRRRQCLREVTPAEVLARAQVVLADSPQRTQRVAEARARE